MRAPISETFSKVEVITGVARRRRFTTEQKLSVVNGISAAGKITAKQLPDAVCARK
jgi:hypothetical protein